MTATDEFYSGTATDPRTYHGADWARWFRSQFTSGVVYNYLNDLAASQYGAGDMKVNVATGSVWAYGYNAMIDAVEVATITANTSGNPRIDRVVARNTIASGITIHVIAGTPGAVPVAPDLVTDGATYYDVPIAWVEVANGASEILTANIHDERIYSSIPLVMQESLIWCGNLDLGGKKIINLAPGSTATDLINKAQADAGDLDLSVPVGSVQDYGSTAFPENVMACDGTAISRTTYAVLFALYNSDGLVYGSGDGSTTFNLPNYTDRIIVGMKSTDTDFTTIGKTGGADSVALVESNLPPHTHTGTSVCATNSLAGSSVGSSQPMGTAGQSEGLGTAHENRMPSIKMPFGVRVY